jgi:hypothetical protein
MLSRPLLVTSLLTLVVLACGGPAPASSQGTSGAAGGACEELAAAGRAELAPVFAANLECTVDADCTLAAFGTSCFDHCVDTVAVSGKAAVEAAKARIEATHCKTFHERGCKSIAPPCAPPSPPGCSKGKCI